MSTSEQDSSSSESLKKELSTYWDKMVQFVYQHFYNGDDGKGPTLVIQCLLAVVVILLFLVIVNVGRLIYNRIKNNRLAEPYLVRDSKDASIVLRIPQDPNDTQSIPLRRSLNENGIEFSYLLWIYVQDFNYRYNQWKHIFHKGNSNSWPNRTPGVWLHPDKNAIRVYMNSYTNITEYTDIEDIPLKKWFHLALVNRNESLDIYINGYLKTRMQLSGVCKQNFGDVWINMNGGFRGYISRMQYFDYAISFGIIEKAVNRGPSFKFPMTAIQQPPYFDATWWSKN